MDTTLTQGIMERLDLVASQVGVAASELWGLWLSTAWVPTFNASAGLAICLVFVLIGVKESFVIFDRFDVVEEYRILWRRTREKLSEDFWDKGGDLANGVAIISAVKLAIAFIALIPLLASFLPNFVKAIPYLIEPRLYALEQLQHILR